MIDIQSLLMGKSLGSGGGGGGGSNIFEWDFTSATPLVDKVRGETAISSDVTFNSSGAVFSSNQKGYIVLSALARAFTIEVDIAELNLTSGTAGRLLQVGISNGKGFNYRGSGVWAVYSGYTNYETDITDPLYFSGHTLKIHVDESFKWHIYRDDDLIFEPNAEMTMERYSGNSNITVYLGSGATSIYNAVISGVRVY